MWIFPLVGMIVGAAGAAVYAMSVAVGLTPLLAAVLALAVMTRLTGGLHEDGLADMADGFGVTGSRLHKMTVMRDSHIGTFGVLTLGFAIAIRATAIAAVGATGVADVAVALILAEAMGRAAMPLAMRLAPPARLDGLGATAAAADDKEALVATIIAVALAGILALTLLQLWRAVWTIMTMLLIARVITACACQHIGGHTGDVLGATGHAVSTAVLVSLAVNL
ncbi:Cobalamin synthase [invertebrate metagenome]|uniref:Adenosylcobinamide-GDP ribazoletransferase n=1 Tax=invertebrate metagenome TaxID=1711999 RepID=A0A484H827_9ZZZZ